MRQLRGGDTITMLASSIGRVEENIIVTTLEQLNVAEVSMKTLLIIGSSATRQIGKFVYTPRYYKESL